MFNYTNINLQDSSLEKIDSVFNNLIVKYHKLKHSTDDINTLIKDSLKTISDILKDKFNLNIELKNVNSGYAYMTPMPSQLLIDIKNKIKDKLNKQVIKKGLTNVNNKILYTLDKIESDLKDGIKIDTEDFKILTDNDYKFTIFLNIKEFINLDLTNRELTAILLHEIGHIWSGFITLPNTVANAVDLTYTMLGYLSDTKDPKEAILKTYNDKLNTDLKIDNVTPEIVFNLYKKYTIDENKYFSAYSDNIRNENMADMLAIKFGYGADLALALTKVKDLLKYEDTIYDLANVLTYSIVIGIIIVQFGIEFILNLILASIIIYGILIVFIVGLLAFLVWVISRLLGTGQLKRDVRTHEDVKTRIQRIKNKIISTAKHIKNKEEAVIIIKQIKNLNGLLNEIHNKLDVKIDKIMTSNSEYELITSIDNLINNELYIQALKLKYNKGV